MATIHKDFDFLAKLTEPQLIQRLIVINTKKETSPNLALLIEQEMAVLNELTNRETIFV
jgi:hypothetical protein